MKNKSNVALFYADTLVNYNKRYDIGEKLQLCIEKHGKKLQIAFPSRRFFLKFLSYYASLRYASLRNLFFLINFAPVLLTNIILQRR